MWQSRSLNSLSTLCSTVGQRCFPKNGSEMIKDHGTGRSTICGYHWPIGYDSEIEQTDRCCSETESVTAQICSGRNRTEPHTQIHASCRGSLTLQSLRILTTDPHPHSQHRLPAAAVCPIHLSLASWVTEEQLTAAAAEHGYRVTQIQHVRQNYTIASAHCA